MMTSLSHLANLHKFLYSFEITIIIYLNMPNLKSISFKMAVLQGQNLPPSCVCYPKDPMWNRVKIVGNCFGNEMVKAEDRGI